MKKENIERLKKNIAFAIRHTPSIFCHDAQTEELCREAFGCRDDKCKKRIKEKCKLITDEIFIQVEPYLRKNFVVTGWVDDK